MKPSWFIPIILFAVTTLAQSQEKELAEFERLVEAIEGVFKTEPVYLNVQKLPSSPTGISCKLVKLVDSRNLAYDVQSTNSLVSPYTAYIRWDGRIKKNARDSGDYREEYLGWIYSGVENCIKDSTFDFFVVYGSSEPHVFDSHSELKMSFSYQKGQWVLKSTQPETYMDVFSYLLEEAQKVK